jgi:hypothetical protein
VSSKDERIVGNNIKRARIIHTVILLRADTSISLYSLIKSKQLAVLDENLELNIMRI